MTEKQAPAGHRPVQLRRTPLLAKVAVCTAILLCAATLVAMHVTLGETEQSIRTMNRQAADLEKENRILADKVEKLGTVESYLQIAAEELGLVEPDTIIIESE